MKAIKLLFVIALLALWSNKAYAQNNNGQAEPYAQIFTDQDKDFLQLWYYEQILKMDLDEDGRDNYRTLLTYYTYRMGKLVLPKYGYSNAEQKTRFDDLTQKLHAEMKDLLNDQNYAIHLESFERIKEKVYKAKEWE